MPPPGGMSAGDRKADHVRRIVATWDAIRACEEFDATTWDVLGSLERQVTDAIYKSPADLRSADRATAKALAYIAGY